MIEIKFRGVTKGSRFYKEGQIVFGSSLDYFLGENEPTIGRNTEQGWENIPVKPDSVCLIYNDGHGVQMLSNLKPESPLKHSVL